MAGKYLEKEKKKEKIVKTEKQVKPHKHRKEKVHHSTVPQIILSVILFALGLCISAGTIRLCMDYHDQLPILLEQPEEISSRIVSMMDAVCEGDYDLAAESMLGKPDFGVDRQAESEIGQLLWDAYLDSISYELIGDCHVTDTGIAQDISITYLDLSSVTASLEQRAKADLEALIQEADDVSEIYDENNEYREEIVMAILHDVTLNALQEDGKAETVRITVNMVFEDGMWWIVPQKELLEAISCGVLS